MAGLTRVVEVVQRRRARTRHRRGAHRSTWTGWSRATVDGGYRRDARPGGRPGSNSAAWRSPRERIAEERTGFVLEQILREAPSRRPRASAARPALTALSRRHHGRRHRCQHGAVRAGRRTWCCGPFPIPRAERLVRSSTPTRQAGIDRAGAASGNVHDWRQRSAAFARHRRLLRDGPYAQHRPRVRGRDRGAGHRRFFAVAGCAATSWDAAFTDDEVGPGQLQRRGDAHGRQPRRHPHRLRSCGSHASPAIGASSAAPSSSSGAPSRVVGVMPEGFATARSPVCKCGCPGTSRPRARAISTTSGRSPRLAPRRRD